MKLYFEKGCTVQDNPYKSKICKGWTYTIKYRIPAEHGVLLVPYM